MTNQQVINLCTAKRDRLMAEVRDKVPVMELERILEGDLQRKHAQIIRCLAAIVCLELHCSNIELKELCFNEK